MDNQLKLRREHLSCLIEPTFNRTTVGYFSVTDALKVKLDETEKCSLVALKEVNKSQQGVIEYEVPNHIEEKDLTKGYRQYSDEGELCPLTHVMNWLQKHPKECEDVDIVCSQEVIARIYRAPFMEETSTPWELKLKIGPDRIVYLEEDDINYERYNEMNSYAQQNHFRNKAFQRYMTVKRGDHCNSQPPHRYASRFCRVNKLVVDSGIIVYNSTAQCFDKNYNSMDLRVQKDGQFDLPGPSVRLSWWTDSTLSGSNTILCGYYDEDDVITKLTSFDSKHVKPRRLRDLPFDDELGAASVCTFVQYVKELAENGSIRSCTLRFEPGSKRVCVLDLVGQKVNVPPLYMTQISATDELSASSSVENTPREPASPREDADLMPTGRSPDALRGETIPRLRRGLSQNGGPPPLKRRNTLTTEMGGVAPPQDIDEDKYKKKEVRVKRRRGEEEDEMNWTHIGIIFAFIAFALIGVPWLFDTGQLYLSR